MFVITNGVLYDPQFGRSLLAIVFVYSIGKSAQSPLSQRKELRGMMEDDTAAKASSQTTYVHTFVANAAQANDPATRQLNMVL